MTPHIVKCPICGKPVEWTPEQRWRPFCSERCKLIDLGEWAEGNRYIPDDAEKPERDDEAHKDSD